MRPAVSTRRSAVKQRIAARAGGDSVRDGMSAMAGGSNGGGGDG